MNHSWLVLAAFVGCAGCGNADDTDTDHTGGAIWPDDATQLFAVSSGSSFEPPPTGSECTMGEAYFTLEVAAQTLSWNKCVAPNHVDPWVFDTGSRTLTQAELDSIDAAMRGLTINPNHDTCGADASERSVVVTTPRGSTTYYDDFYACRDGDRMYVTDIGGVFSVLRSLTED